MDNYNKILLLFQKLDDGSISDLEIGELNNIIDFGNFDTNVINPNLENQLNDINTDITGFDEVDTNDFLDDYLNKFNDKISKIDSSVVNNTTNLTNNLTNSVTTGIVTSSKFTSIIASISFISIIGISYLTYNYFTNQEKIDNKNEQVIQNDKNIKVSEENSNNNIDKTKETENLDETNKSIVNNEYVNQNNSDNLDKNNVNGADNDKNVDLKLKLKELRADKDLAVYNDEILSIFVQNTGEFNKVLQNYTNKLKIAQKNNDINNQVEILYKLAVIYRVKNISVEKSIEILNRAISLIDNSKVNENDFNIIKSDIYGELFKSYKSIGNLNESNLALKKCLNCLNNPTTNSENKIVVNKKAKYWNDILNSQQ